MKILPVTLHMSVAHLNLYLYTDHYLLHINWPHCLPSCWNYIQYVYHLVVVTHLGLIYLASRKCGLGDQCRHFDSATNMIKCYIFLLFSQFDVLTSSSDKTNGFPRKVYSHSTLESSGEFFPGIPFRTKSMVTQMDITTSLFSAITSTLDASKTYATVLQNLVSELALFSLISSLLKFFKFFFFSG